MYHCTYEQCFLRNKFYLRGLCLQQVHNGSQSRLYRWQIYGPQTEQAGCRSVTKQNKDGAKRRCAVIEGRSTRVCLYVASKF